MRTYFRKRLHNEELLTAAYSLESVLIELIFILGPLIVALFVALASPALAVLFAAACGLVGTLLFLRSPPLLDWRVEPHSARSLLGPLAQTGFRALVAVIFCYSMAFGLLEVGMAAYATEAGNVALAGVLLGLMSTGSALGGLVYGSRSWHVPLARQFALMLALMGSGLAVLAFPWSAWAFACSSESWASASSTESVCSSESWASASSMESVCSSESWALASLTVSGCSLKSSLPSEISASRCLSE
jgi:hypothetical protein